MRSRGVATGTVRGLWETLGRAVKGLNGQYGACEIGRECHVVVPVPDLLAWSMFLIADSPSLPAGSVAYTTLLTVPADERWRMRALQVNVQSGDNFIAYLGVIFPVAYRRDPGGIGATDMYLTADLATTTELRLPNAGGVNYLSDVSFLLEPGTLLRVGGDGVGVAATTYRIRAVVEGTKVVRDKGL